MTTDFRLALRPTPGAWQRAAIRALLCKLPLANQRNLDTWATVLWMVGAAEQADVGEAARDLKHLAAALAKVGPTARIALLHASVDVMALANLVGRMAAQARRGVRRGRPGADGARMLAELLAQAYADLTQTAPPSTDPYDHHATTHPYHVLASALFSLAGLDGWAFQARQTARRLQKGEPIGLRKG